MSQRREVIPDTELYTRFLIPGIVELLVIVTDNDSGDPKLVDDGPPCKVMDVLLSNLCQGFNFHPLGEVVNGYHQEPHLSFPHGKWPNYVDSPLRKGSGPYYWDQFFWEYLRDIGKSLTLIALLGEERGLVLHR